MVFSADVQELFDFGDDCAGSVVDLDGEDSLDLFFGGEKTVPRPGFLKWMVADLSQTM